MHQAGSFYLTISICINIYKSKLAEFLLETIMKIIIILISRLLFLYQSFKDNLNFCLSAKFTFPVNFSFPLSLFLITNYFSSSTFKIVYKKTDEWYIK